jgi:nucleoside-diphosphate-sugar epimerase
VTTRILVTGGTGTLGRSGDGLDAAVAGVDTIVACVDPIQQLVDAAKRAGSRHLVYISIVGIDRVPFPYYRHKLADEQLIAASGRLALDKPAGRAPDFAGPGGPNHGRSRAQLPQDGRQAAPDHAGVVARQGFSRLPRRRAPGTGPRGWHDHFRGIHV